MKVRGCDPPHATFDFKVLDTLTDDFKLGEEIAPGAFGVDASSAFRELVKGLAFQASDHEVPFSIVKMSGW